MSGDTEEKICHCFHYIATNVYEVITTWYYFILFLIYIIFGERVVECSCGSLLPPQN